MNPTVLAVRIGVMALVCVAFVMSVSSNFMRVSLGGPDSGGPHDLEFNVAIWRDWGVLGGALAIVGLLCAVTALVVSAYAPVAAKIIDFLTAAILVAAGGTFVAFVLTFGSDAPVDASFGFGWSGIVTLCLLAIAAVLSVVAGLLTKPVPARLAAPFNREMTT